ncbi:DUF1223 domain-containing protein [Pseudoroseicyclus aestuarii]|uniref:Secreted protein n=1 Tax=Pseudoroseicyclus aestuarii TaxID=1795041 RepID=A0A318SVP1_9RHOB|nr:DUF1223 domain-containing protein [Pseudoroseicyclus aestuarii]PYE85495.1 hypothetical protein DFP88_101162 [Pseudoroseicyclus aestuarii]
MRRIIFGAAAAVTLLAGGVRAGDDPVVVELFTSQGCSSCPPADEMLADLSRRDDVIALGLHVDYWDYIGWPDRFADQAYTSRQQHYAAEAGERTIYTPQFVVGGRRQVTGARPIELMDAIQAHEEAPEEVHVALEEGADGLWLTAPAAQAPRPMAIHLVHYQPESRVEIEAGENAGRTLTYANIVTSWEVLGEWDGSTPLRMQLPQGGGPGAVLVQATGHHGPGAILAAARLD